MMTPKYTSKLNLLKSGAYTCWLLANHDSIVWNFLDTCMISLLRPLLDTSLLTTLYHFDNFVEIVGMRKKSDAPTVGRKSTPHC